MKKMYAPNYPLGVYKYSDWTKTWELQRLFMVWSDAEEWLEKNCPEGMIMFRW